ncbi:MAG: RidA family protein [Proteobacteria bacterium]|nr:RidA family protein [Pseudomonadota bacterium]
MSKKIISTTKAPSAIGPYSQAVKAGNLVFTSGQIPLDPETGKVVEGGIRDQAHQALRNLRAICEEAGGSLLNVVKTTLFLTDMSQFKAVNEVYAEYFTDQPPARSTVQVAALPLGVHLEIEAVLSF